MNIFLDESGRFSNLEGQNNRNLNCLVAVVMIDDALDAWNKKYGNLEKASLIKDVEKIHEIIDFLVSTGAKAFIVFTDIAQYYTATGEHKRKLNESTQVIINGYKNYYQTNFSLPIHKLSDVDYMKFSCSKQVYENAARGILASPWNENDINVLKWHFDDPVANKTLKETFLNSLLFDLSEADVPMRVLPSNIQYYLSSCHKYIDYRKVFQNNDFVTEIDQPGIKAADCAANFMRRGLTKNELFNDDQNFKNLEKLFSLPYSVDALHFNDNKEFLDSSELITPTIRFFQIN